MAFGEKRNSFPFKISLNFISPIHFWSLFRIPNFHSQQFRVGTVNFERTMRVIACNFQYDYTIWLSSMDTNSIYGSWFECFSKEKQFCFNHVQQRCQIREKHKSGRLILFCVGSKITKFLMQKKELISVLNTLDFSGLSGYVFM